MTRPAPAIRPDTAQYPSFDVSLICVAIQINTPAPPAAMSVVVPRVSPYMRSPRSVVANRSIPPCLQTEPGYKSMRPSNTRPWIRAFGKLEIDAPGVESGGIELVSELLDRPGDVVREDVLDDSDLGVVVPGNVHVLMRDEVHGRPLAGRAPDRES